MATILVCSNPVQGHVTPMLDAAAHLVARGHRVIALTGSRFADQARASGAEFRALQGLADYDDRAPATYLPDRHRYRGLARAQYDIQTIFVKPIPDQYRGVLEILSTEHVDRVLVDGAFGGVAPLLFGNGPRPPILALGVTPLTQSSRDVAPTGTALPPSSTPIGRVRNSVLQLIARRVLFRQTQQLGERIFAELGVHSDHFIMDISSAFDRFLQLCTREFEYPRSDLAPNTAFIGPMPPRDESVAMPSWWETLDDARPLVVVNQGTVDNHDFGRLIRPALSGLADLDVQVVATLGGGSPEALGRLPANAVAESYVSHEPLLRRAAVFVTNGGYGGVQRALRHGVPMVVAGDTEDKPEVAARVAWSGTGIDLRTGSPSPAAIRAAVSRVLSEQTYRRRAGAVSASIASCATVDLLEHELLAGA